MGKAQAQSRLTVTCNGFRRRQEKDEQEHLLPLRDAKVVLFRVERSETNEFELRSEQLDCPLH